MHASVSAVAAKNPAKTTGAIFVPLTHQNLVGLVLNNLQSDQPIKVLRDLPALTDTSLPTLHLSDLKEFGSHSLIAWEMLGETRKYYGNNPSVNTETGQIRFETDQGHIVTLTPKKTQLQ